MAAPPHRRTGAAHRLRPWISALLVVATAVAVLIGSAAWWVRTSLLHTEAFMGMVEPVVESPDTAAAVSAHLTERTFTTLRIEERIADALAAFDTYLRDEVLTPLGMSGSAVRSRFPPPPDLTRLAEPIAAGLQQRVEDAVTEVLASEEFTDALNRAIAAAHSAAVAIILDEETPGTAVVVRQGDVVLDLRSVAGAALVHAADAVAEALGLDLGRSGSDVDPDARLQTVTTRLGVDLPDDYGEVVLIPAERLDPYRDAVALFDRYLWLVLAVAAALAVAAVLVARDRVRATVWLGIGVIATLLLSWVVVDRVRKAVVADVAAGQPRHTVDAVLQDLAAGLRGLQLVVIAAAAAVVLLALATAWRRPAPADTV